MKQTSATKRSVSWGPHWSGPGDIEPGAGGLGAAICCASLRLSVLPRGSMRTRSGSSSRWVTVSDVVRESKRNMRCSMTPGQHSASRPGRSFSSRKVPIMATIRAAWRWMVLLGRPSCPAVVHRLPTPMTTAAPPRHGRANEAILNYSCLDAEAIIRRKLGWLEQSGRRPQE